MLAYIPYMDPMGYIYIYIKHLLNIYKDDLCMIQNHIQILKQNSLDRLD